MGRKEGGRVGEGRGECDVFPASDRAEPDAAPEVDG